MSELPGKSEDDVEVGEMRKKMMEESPISRILAHLNEEGHFVHQPTIKKYGEEFAAFGYLPKYKATTWRLLMLAQLGADPDHPLVKKICRYVLDHCYSEEHRSFCYRNPHTGQHFLAPCFAGNMVWALCQLGLQQQAKVIVARRTLIRYARYDDGDFQTPTTWPYCGRRDRCYGSHSCYAGSLKALKAAATIPPEHRDKETKDFIQRGIDFFLLHRVYKASRHPGKLLNFRVDKLTFPNMIYPDFLEILEVLVDLGVRDERMKDAIELLKSKQLSNGRWPLEKEIANLPTTFGKKGQENKWVTQRALRVLSKIEKT
jgi:hypothetical protein